MLASVATALVLAASVSRVAAGPIDHVARGYAQDAAILEDYTPYHIRYLALNCTGGHGSPFFEKCCHPLLRSQKLSDRPKECIPSQAAIDKATQEEPSAPTIDEDPLPATTKDECDPEADPEDDDECDEDPEPPKPSSPATSTKAAEPTHAPVTEHPTSTYRPSTTHVLTSSVPTTSAKPDDNNNNNGGGQLIKGGQATWFEQKGVAGACGAVHSDDDFIVAMDYRRYGNPDAKSKFCGKKVLITNTETGKQITATIADCCPTCRDGQSLDLSTGAFKAVVPDYKTAGVFPIDYKIMD